MITRLRLMFALLLGRLGVWIAELGAKIADVDL